LQQWLAPAFESYFPLERAETMKTVVTIVPRLPPAVCGVGDTAVAIAESMERRHSIETTFVTGDIQAPPAEVSWPSQSLRQRSATLLRHALGDSPAALLHYAGYGFARRGCPFWLADGLEAWLRHEGTRLVVVFHELYATGPVWTSAFWLSRTQKSLARRLAEAATLVIVTRRSVANEVAVWRHGDVVRHLPITSSVGELPQPSPIGDREKRLVIFGGAGVRSGAYAHPERLERVCRALGVEEIVDIGPGNLTVSLPRFERIRITPMGVLNRADVSRVLADSVAGYVAYHADCLAKSSIFAAYAAHGMLPITNADHHSEADGLIAGQQYLVAASLTGADEAVAAAAHRWYWTHRLDVFGDLISASLSETVGYG
jgi:hypothetical protein